MRTKVILLGIKSPLSLRQVPLGIAGNALMSVDTCLGQGKMSGVSLGLVRRTLNIGAAHHNDCLRERLVRISVHHEIDKNGDFE